MANENGILRKRGRGRVASRNEHLLHEIRLTRSMEDLKTGCVRVRVLVRSKIEEIAHAGAWIWRGGREGEAG